MSSKYQRPEGAYMGVDGTNRTKYQDDAAAVPKRSISSVKMDGDLNYIVDALNETWDHLTAASFSTALPDQAGHANHVPVTNGTTTGWQLVANDSVQNSTLTLGKMAPLAGAGVVGAAGDGIVAALTLGTGLDVQSGALAVTVPGVPTGMMAPFAGTAAPGGWLLCAGQAVSRTTYAALFAVLGTTYGTGDGSSTFNLPDMRGRAVFGVDNMGGTAASRVTSAVSGVSGTTLGATGGDQRAQLHTHNATVTDPGHKHGERAGGTGATDRLVSSGGGGSVASGLYFSSGLTSSSSLQGTLTEQATTGVTVALDNAGSGTSQNMPPAMMLNWIVKA